MGKLSQEEIRKTFECATDFNDIFDAFEQAVALRIDNLELYTLLFWNKSLSADEVALFAEQVAVQFPHLAYATYLWLGEMAALTLASRDNFERALFYYKKAARQKPSAAEPYINAAACYDPYIKIPPLQVLIEFLKSGVGIVTEPHALYSHLAYFYEQLGNDELTQYYRRLAGPPTDIS